MKKEIMKTILITSIFAIIQISMGIGMLYGGIKKSQVGLIIGGIAFTFIAIATITVGAERNKEIRKESKDDLSKY